MAPTDGRALPGFRLPSSLFSLIFFLLSFLPLLATACAEDGGMVTLLSWSRTAEYRLS